MRLRRSYFALVLLTLPIPLPAQPAESPAERRLAEFVEVVSSADPERVRTMVQQSFATEFRDAFPIDSHLEILAGLARETGGIEVTDVQMSSPNVLTARVRPRNGSPPLSVQLRIEPDPPHRIAGVGVRPAEGPRPAPAATPAEAAQRLRAHVDSLAAADRFSGVVLLEKDGEILLHDAWGQAEKAFGAPNRPDTKFNLGSMNKMFTAVTVARLVEDGRLALDDTIGKYLGPEWLQPGIGDRVTIEHLLTHTSGLGSYYSPELMELNPGRFRQIDDFQEIVRRDSLRFEPGTQWSYSNTGFLLLGAIVERVTGRSYYDVVRELVYEPAGMTDTDAFMFDAPTPNLAIGYERDGDGWRSNVYGHVVRGGPAGGGYSMAPDLLAFARAMRENKLLSPEMTRRVTTPKPEIGSPEYGYGFGFWDQGRVVGHTGGAPGISAALQIDLERGTTLVVLSNYGQTAIPVVRYADALLGYGPDR
jgi:CubicO group peptidase (beta-lactamase class C family)